MADFKKILFVLGQHSERIPPTFYKAFDLAAKNGAHVTLLKVIPDYSQYLISGLDLQQLQRKYLTQEKEILDDTLRSINHSLKVHSDVIVGKRYIEVIRKVQDNAFDLVIKEADKLDWLERLIGSDDMHLLRKCPCPVWLLPPVKEINLNRIVVAISLEGQVENEYDLLNEGLLDYAARFTLAYNAELHVLNVFDVPEIGFISLWASEPEKVEKDMLASEYTARIYKMQRLLEKLESKIGKEAFYKLAIKKHIVQGVADQKIPELLTKLKADLVVMGTVSRSGIAGVIIGNTAESVLSQINTSVLTIKPKGFKFPS